MSWKTTKTAYIATKTKTPNMELKYYGQSTMGIQKNTPTIFLQFYLILFYFNSHFIHFFPSPPKYMIDFSFSDHSVFPYDLILIAVGPSS